MADVRRRVAVTGAAGYIGGRLVQRLEQDDSVESVLALDVSPESTRYSDKVESIRQDITEPFSSLFSEHQIDAVVHLAYVLNPGHRRSAGRRVNVTGTEHVLDACASAEVSHVLYLSSTSVYGAHPDNPEFLTEDDPVRPIRGFQYSEDKAAAEAVLRAYAAAHPSVGITVLRSCPVMGPNADNFIANAFRKPVLPSVGAADPPMQLLHEDDLIDVLTRCLERRPVGTYNVAGEGTIRWSEMASIINTPLLRLPAFVLYPLTSVCWHLRLQSDSPAAGLNFVRYRWTRQRTEAQGRLGNGAAILVPRRVAIVRRQQSGGLMDRERVIPRRTRRKMQPTTNSVVIDADTGTDDAIALVAAVNSPELNIRGLTTVAGNARVAHTTRNALRLMDYLGRPDIPRLDGRVPTALGPVRVRLRLSRTGWTHDATAGYRTEASGVTCARIPGPNRHGATGAAYADRPRTTEQYRARPAAIPAAT